MKSIGENDNVGKGKSGGHRIDENDNESVVTSVAPVEASHSIFHTGLLTRGPGKSSPRHQRNTVDRGAKSRASSGMHQT